MINNLCDTVLCGGYAVQSKCIHQILQGTTAEIELFVIGYISDTYVKVRDNITEFKIALINEFGDVVFYVDAETNIDTFSLDEYSFKIKITDEISKKYTGKLFAEVIFKFENSEDVYGFPCVLVANLVESKILKYINMQS